MTETSSVRGRVTQTSGQPLGKAEVLLIRNDRGFHWGYGAISSADGSFLLEGVEPAQYRLVVERYGYINEAAGRDPLTGAPLLTLIPGKHLDGIVVALTPQAVISGCLTDEDGDPVAVVSVALLQEIPSPEGSKLVSVRQLGNEATNDLGEFRFPGLLPGRYFLCANWIQKGPNRMGRRIRWNLQEDVYPPLYFPGTTDPSLAEPIDIAAGEDLRDFHLQVKKIHTYRIRGRAELPADADPRSLSLNLCPQPLSHQARTPQASPRADNWERVGGPDFDLAGVLPGLYHLMVNFSLTGSPHKQRTVQITVEIKDHDIDGLIINFPSGFALQGSVRPVPDSPDFKPASVSIGLHPESGGMQLEGRPAAPAGDFTIYYVPPGRYRVSVFLMPGEGYIKSVAYSVQDVFGQSIEIGESGPAGMLEILVAYDGGEVSGTVQDGNGVPLPNHRVQLLTGPPRFDRPRIATTDQDGRFSLRQVQPGEYLLFPVAAPRPGVPLEQLWEEHQTIARMLTVLPNGRQEVLIRSTL